MKTFKDKNGNQWTEENLQDIIDGMNSLISFLSTLNYYKGRLLKD